MIAKADAASMRIRLEGAVETLEKAIERYGWAKGVFVAPWRTSAGLQLSRGLLRVGNRLKADVGDRLARDIRGWVGAQRQRHAGKTKP